MTNNNNKGTVVKFTYFLGRMFEIKHSYSSSVPHSGTDGVMETGLNVFPLCLSTTLFETGGAQISDSGMHRCEALIGASNKSISRAVMIDGE